MPGKCSGHHTYEYSVLLSWTTLLNCQALLTVVSVMSAHIICNWCRGVWCGCKRVRCPRLQHGIASAWLLSAQQDCWQLWSTVHHCTAQGLQLRRYPSPSQRLARQALALSQLGIDGAGLALWCLHSTCKALSHITCFPAAQTFNQHTIRNQIF